jgi:hypothetical protein
MKLVPNRNSDNEGRWSRLDGFVLPVLLAPFALGFIIAASLSGGVREVLRALRQPTLK